MKKNSRRRKYQKRMKGGQTPDKKIFNFDNYQHYGDNMLNLKFLFNISKHLKDNNIFINYYYNADYIKNVDELQRYVNPDTVQLFTYDKKPSDSVSLWMRDPINGVTHDHFDTFYPLFYANILNILGLQNLSIDTSLYQKEDYLLDIYEKLDPKYKDIDILVHNSQPMSGQGGYDKGKMDAMCIRLTSKYKIVVISPINDSIVCTMDDGLKMQDIGAISTHAKYIIGLCSGPLVPCFNSYTKNNVKKWIVFHNKLFLKEINSIITTDSAILDTIEIQLT